MKQNNLSLFILSMFCICCFQVQPTSSDPILVMSAAMKQQMTETVVPSYCTAYTILNEHIVQKLLQLNVNSTEETVRMLADSLLCAVKNVQEELQIAIKPIEQICNATDAQIAQLILSVSGQEENVRQSQDAVNLANVNLQQSQQQVALAETAVHDAHHSLNGANQAVHDAHKAVERARHCGIGRRRKRFLKKIFRKVFLRPICAVVNSGGIDRAKDRRGIAEQHLHNTRARLQTSQGNLAHKRAEYDAAQTRLHTANVQLQTTKSTLEQLRSQQLLWMNLLKQFKDIELHLANVLSPSKVLLDEIAGLVDFETVITPLNNIYKAILENQLMAPAGFTISAETTAQIKANLVKLSEVLPNVPLHNMSDASSETDVLAISGSNCSFSAIKQQCSAHPSTK